MVREKWTITGTTPGRKPGTSEVQLVPAPGSGYTGNGEATIPKNRTGKGSLIGKTVTFEVDPQNPADRQIVSVRKGRSKKTG